MPILVIFLVTAACLPVEWPAPPLGLGAGASAGLTAAAVLLPLLAAFAVRTRVVRAVAADPSRLAEAGRRYSRARRMLFFVNLGAVVLAVVGLGWGWTVRHALRVNWNGSEVLAPFADLAVPLPYFLLAFGTWLVYYDAEGALHRGPRFPPRAAYFVHNLRQLALLVGLPVGLFAGQQTVARFFPETARADVYRAAAVAVVPVLILVLPLLVKPLLGLKPLPPGPVRDRLEALARRLRFRSAGLLVWPTHGHGANALILGLVPRVRYVVFTDALLDALPDDERDAVFGHEVGHARHGHVWYYAVFLALSMAVLAAGLLLGMRELAAAADADPGAWYTPVLTDEVGWTAFLPVVLAAGYVFLVFGFVSRRCERQADVFGCRAVSCGNPRCDGHDEATVYPPGGAAAGCPTGIRTFARALERVAALNGWEAPAAGRRSAGGLARAVAGWLRAWQHGPIPRRVEYLRSLVGRPDRERRFQRRLLVLRVGLAAALVAALVVLGREVGWSELLAAL